MSNDLSRQLCELCGIKPKFFALMQSEENWEEIPESVYYKIKDCSTTRIIYPDFTKPENFVRLFDLPIVNNGTRTVGYFVVYEFTMKTIKDFIECLIIKLERTQFSITKEVKQSIRKAEWVYE